MLELVKADLTTLAVDAVVNAANAALSGGGGVDWAIHRAAGPELLAACRLLGPCKVGEAVVTPGFRLPARLVIHAVGPVWRGGDQREDELLTRTYFNALELAVAHQARSVAVPAISTGAYRFPLARATRLALTVLSEYAPRFERLVACVFDDATLAEYRKQLVQLG